jgi:hypothetical protein
MITNQKAVSRERLIGISFVDILIQAVFLLFLALTVGYTDPLEKIKTQEYAQMGEDLCKKSNKKSVQACREYLDPILDREKGKSALALCLKPISDNQPTMSAQFLITSPTEVSFGGFTPEFLAYLKKNNDETRLQQAKNTRIGSYDIGEIDRTFGFMREKKCFHSIPTLNVKGAIDQKDLRDMIRALNQLKNIEK